MERPAWSADVHPSPTMLRACRQSGRRSVCCGTRQTLQAKARPPQQQQALQPRRMRSVMTTAMTMMLVLMLLALMFLMSLLSFFEHRRHHHHHHYCHHHHYHCQHCYHRHVLPTSLRSLATWCSPLRLAMQAPSTVSPSTPPCLQLCGTLEMP